jgi:sterol desaturase/sphingolipid hydroxylase (fatty acid hydroxylase superfamily)
MKNPLPQEALFKNPLLKLLSYTNRSLTVGYILTYVFVLLYCNYIWNQDRNVWVSLLFFTSGLFIWTLFEYILHRYIFHIQGNTKVTKRFAYVMHGVHHDHPRDENYVFMPPFPGTIYIAIFFILFWSVLRFDSFLFLAVFILGYLIYSNIHYYIHLKRPVKRFAFFWRHHSLHHYKYPDKAFGVSSALWDIVFQTMPPSHKETQAIHPIGEK